ncbi:MAG: ferrochelatase [Legionellaceae bacterium]|nr:ferrochelatase [Legionellaceae bacterium]
MKHQHQHKHGLLLIQLGTPESPGVQDVRRYLRVFLSDKRVLDIPAFVRYVLLNLIILPFRSKRSAEAYQKIWTEQGSPLRTLSVSLKNKLQKSLAATHTVVLGMRYGEPSLKQAMKDLAHCESITVLPLYPQYASSSTGSSLEEVFTYFRTQTVIPSLRIIRDFYAHPAFIQAQAKQIQPYLNNSDYCLFSYHGLPERHIEKSGCKTVCLNNCPKPEGSNNGCYRAQCFESTRQLVETLGLNPAQYSTSFQSRLGKTPWIKPYTDEMLEQLAHQGIKRLVVACPAFVTDCLETLEEIGMQAKEQWLALGGESLTLVPCLNDEDHWVKALVDITAAAMPSNASWSTKY